MDGAGEAAGSEGNTYRIVKKIGVARPFASTPPGATLPDSAKPPRENGGTMKKTSHRKSTGRSREDMRREYRFDYRKARPNRFAGRFKGGTVAVVLDPDVASVFRSSESVNTLLRSVISALPEQTRASAKSG